MDFIGTLIEKLFEIIAYFKFWRVIPIHKEGVKVTWGKNPKVMKPGLHFIWPFEITHTQTVIVKPEWASTLVVHITTKDLKTISVGPILKYTIVNTTSWFYGVNDALTNLHDAVRFCTADVLTDCSWEECMTKPVWTKIKNKIKDKTKEIGIEIDDFGLIDLAISRIIITNLNE